MTTIIQIVPLVAAAYLIIMAQLNMSSAPVAKKEAKVSTLHGDPRVDNYSWLRNKNAPEVLGYLEAENAYTEAVMKPTEALQETVYKEILERTKQADLSVPYRLGEYWYYTRTEEGKQYPIYCRKRGSLEAPEQVVLELNKLAKEHKFLGLGLYQVSDDGNLLAYSLDTTGSRQYQLHFKNLTTGEVLPDSIGQVNTGVWASDHKTLFYVKEDRAKRPNRLYRHVLGRKKDDLLYQEKDELYRIFTRRSSDKKLVFLTIESSITSEVRYLPSHRPADHLKILLPREPGHEYEADHRENLFYIRTNKGAKNFRLVTAEDADPTTWKELLPPRASVKLEGINLFKNFAVFHERQDGLDKLRVYDFRSAAVKDISFPEPVYSAFPSTNPEYDTPKFRYSYQSFTTPSSIFECDMETGEQVLLKQTEVLGGYNSSEYRSERLHAKAPDGTLVPISLVFKKTMKRDGKAPLLLYGYGAYGISIPVAFSIPRLSLLDRGFVFALAHVRGGGDLGEEWRDEGKMRKKMNTFTDFIACAEHLIAEGYTSRERLLIEGGSAGGLLIGAVLNRRPDLFRAAHLAVPFVDVINTMLDESLPLTVGEFLEWGNPKVKEDYEYMKSYCPYTNIEARHYPDILITTSLNDSQVMYWEPAKYTAKLRATKTGESVLLMKTNMGAGHGGASGRYDAFKEQAFVNAFLLNEVGINK